MRDKPTCSICHARFTRRGNMLRHMEKLHNVMKKGIAQNSVFSHRTQQSPFFQASENTASGYEPLTAFERSLATISGLTKLSSEYIQSMNIFRTINDLKNKVAIYENEIAIIKSYYWLVPIREVQGLSCYVCRRCNYISFTKIRDLGYDMTMRARHRCNEEKVRSIKMVSIRPSDVWNLYNFAASIMLEALNSIMPGKKYLLAEDKSSLFNFLESRLSPDVVKILLGIPDRFYYYSLHKNQKIDWLNRAVANLGTETSVEDFEIKDFLRRVESTYAIFEIPDGQTLRRILIKITPRR
jgi:hypothetical protein